MRMKSRRTLAVLLSMILLLALAPSGFAVDLDPGINSVTVECVPQGSDFAEDLATATIQADLYLLAPAVRYEEPYENVDSYTYQVPEEGTVFHDLLKTLTEELNGADTPEVPPAEKDVFDQFEHYAQDFAKIVLDSSYTPDPDRIKSATAVAGKTFINVPNLDAGLYLLIIRGQELTEKDSSDHPEKVYVKKTEQASSDENGAATTLFTTRVLTEDYEYLFKPQLFTLPTKLDKNVQQYNTAYGEWENQLSIYAKPTRVANNGDLKIIKNVNNPGPDPVDFVFEVTWKDKSNNDVTKVVTMTFKGDTRKEYTLVNTVPIGTEVTVTEVHSGIGYTAVTGPQTVTIQAPAAATAGGETAAVRNVVEFTNDHTGPGGGHGILNRFTAGSNSSFDGVGFNDSEAADANKPLAG